MRKQHYLPQSIILSAMLANHKLASRCIILTYPDYNSLIGC